VSHDKWITIHSIHSRRETEGGEYSVDSTQVYSVSQVSLRNEMKESLEATPGDVRTAR